MKTVHRFILVTLALSVGCGGELGSEQIGSKEAKVVQCTLPPTPGQTCVFSVYWAGYYRRVHVYVPTSFNYTNRPVIFALHGGGGKATNMINRFTALANAQNVIIAAPWGFPQGSTAPPSNTDSAAWPDNRTWQVGKRWGNQEDWIQNMQIDDASYIVHVRGMIWQYVYADMSRIYLAGLSKGGMLAQRIACKDTTGAFQAVFAHSSVLFKTENCNAAPMPIRLVHGASDSNVEFDDLVVENGVTHPPMSPSDIVHMSFWQNRSWWLSHNAANLGIYSFTGWLDTPNDATCERWGTPGSRNQVWTCYNGAAHDWFTYSADRAWDFFSTWNQTSAASIPLLGVPSQLAVADVVVRTYTAAQATTIVQRLYRCILGREADPGGLAGWSALVQQGRLRATVNGFVLSAEFQNRRPSMTPLGWGAEMYRKLLDREPEAGAAEGCANMISTGLGGQRIVEILESPEYMARNGIY